MKLFILNKGNLHNQNDMLEVKMNYIEEEIDIRVESLKVELDQAGKNLKNELRDI
jgi:hypothetical protein